MHTSSWPNLYPITLSVPSAWGLGHASLYENLQSICRYSISCCKMRFYFIPTWNQQYTRLHRTLRCGVCYICHEAFTKHSQSIHLHQYASSHSRPCTKASARLGVALMDDMAKSSVMFGGYDLTMMCKGSDKLWIARINYITIHIVLLLHLQGLPQGKNGWSIIDDVSICFCWINTPPYIIMASRPSTTADSVSLPPTKRLDSHFINGRNLFMVIFHIAHGKTPTAEEHDILMGDDM